MTAPTQTTACVIDRFDGTEYDFLSNFHPSTIKYDGRVYRTVEHAYQAAKTNEPIDKKRIGNASTPGEAKRHGKRCTLRKDWEAIKNNVMLDLLRVKFSHEPYRSQLLATGNSKLIEGNTWGDQYWGVCRGKGKNMLGVLLMKVRDEVRSIINEPTA
jgi:ribA/ribD-fused uncharacterized protein